MKTSKRSAFSFIVFFLTQASTKSEKELLNTSTETLKQLSEMMNEFRGNKAAKRSAFCERFLWSQITIRRYSQKNSVIVYNWFFDLFE